MKSKNHASTRRRVSDPGAFLISLALGAWLIAQPVSSLAVFDASLAPPRFELKSKPGEIARATVSVSNGSSVPARYTVKTADWRLDANGQVVFEEGAPRAGSCRPWARLERREISVPPNGSRNFRFEIHVPKDAPVGECRLALLFAGEATTVVPGGSNQIQIPIIGRVAAIVYVGVGDAKADLRLATLAVRRIDNKNVPVAEFLNQGNAHGRISGALEAKDAAGHVFTLVADQSAILPKGRRAVVLVPVDYSSGEPKTPSFELQPPLHVRGKLSLSGGGEISIDQIVR